MDLEVNKEREILLTFYQKFNEKVLLENGLILLRPKYTPNIESYFNGDFDYLTTYEKFEGVINIIYELCKNRGINFKLRQGKSNKKRFEFFIRNPEECTLVFEFWTAIEFTSTINNAKKSFSSESIYNLIKANEVDETAVLSLIYITHLFHKKKNIISVENKHRFDIYLKKLFKSESFLQEESFILLKKLGENKIDINQANDRSIQLLKSKGVKEKSRIANRISRFLKKRKIQFINLNRIIPVIGPDGVGKGSITEEWLNTMNPKLYISRRFKTLYRKGYLYPIRLFFLFDKERLPKNFLDEKINYFIFFSSLISIWFMLLKNQSKVILMDRYFVDYFGTSIRNINESSHPHKVRLYRILLRLTPSPNRAFFLGCRNSTLESRKDELSIVAIHFLQKLYCEFIITKNIPEVFFISTEGNSIQESTFAFNYHIKKTEFKSRFIKD